MFQMVMLIVTYTERHFNGSVMKFGQRNTVDEYTTIIVCNICRIYRNDVDCMSHTEEQHQKLIEDIRA